MRKKIWHSKSLSKNIKKRTGPKFEDQFERLMENIEYQADRLGFDLTDDAITDRLLEVGNSPIDDDPAESGTEAMYAERFLALAYVQSLIAYGSREDDETVAALCLGNWLVGILGGMHGTDHNPLVCPSCIIDSYKASVARTGGAGRSAKLKVLEAETIRLYEAGKWDSVPLAAQAITPAVVEFSKKNGPKLLPSTAKPIEWIRDHLRSKRPT